MLRTEEIPLRNQSMKKYEKQQKSYHHLCYQGLEKFYTVEMNNWVDGFNTFSLLYFTHNIIADDAFNSMDSLPMMDDLNCEPTTEELSKTIDMMALGSDSIPVDLLRYCK